MTLRGAAVLALLLAGAPAAHAQTSAAEGIARYREMLADGNPAELFEAKGERLWAEKRGPKNASLERCDLGKGPGVVKGAFVELPRWFADTQHVQDLESRLLSCMEALQGLDAKAIAATPFGRDEQGHALRIVHGAISAKTILVSWRGHVKLVKFGFARAKALYPDPKRGPDLRSMRRPASIPALPRQRRARKVS